MKRLALFGMALFALAGCAAGEIVDVEEDTGLETASFAVSTDYKSCYAGCCRDNDGHFFDNDDGTYGCSGMDVGGFFECKGDCFVAANRVAAPRSGTAER